MRDVLYGGAAVAAAFLIHAGLQQLSVPVQPGLNVFAVAVIVFGLVKGEIGGAIVGMICGLIVDAFSLGLFGLAGVSYTVTGFLAGTIAKKIHVLAFGRLLTFMGIMGAINLALVVLLASVFVPGGVPWRGGWLLVQPLITAVLGTAVVLAYRRLKARHDR